MTTVQGVTVTGPRVEGQERVLTDEALGFVAALVRAYQGRVDALLAARVARQAALDAGQRLDFLPETAAVRAGDWRVAPLPADLLDRRVETTGPLDRKMIINAMPGTVTLVAMKRPGTILAVERDGRNRSDGFGRRTVSVHRETMIALPVSGSRMPSLTAPSSARR